MGALLYTTVGVHQQCPLSPVLLNIILENIMHETLYDHHISISIRGRPICNICFAGDMDLLADTNRQFEHI